MALLRATNCGVSPEGVAKMSKHVKIHGVRDAWAHRCREVNGSPDEDRKASASDDQKCCRNQALPPSMVVEAAI